MPKSFVQLYSSGKYKYKCLPKGIKIAPDVFQNVMSKLTRDMEYAKTYLDDLLILTNGDFKDHLTKLEMVPESLSTAGVRANTLKSNTLQNRLSYLITRKGIQLVSAQ